MTARAWGAAATIALLLGAALLGVGLFLGYSTVHRDGVNCGSALHPSSDGAFTQELENTMLGQQPTTRIEDACQAATSDAAPTDKVLIVAGVALLVAGVGCGLVWGYRSSTLAASAETTLRPM
jgi:hypothetical protein